MIASNKKKYLHSESILEDVMSGIKLCKILRDKEAIAFVKKLIVEHYKKFFSNNGPEILIINKTFELLTKGQTNNASIVNLKESIDSIYKNIYSHKKNTNFTQKYNQYKSSLKPKYYYSVIKNDIVGKKILDFGTGKGHMSNYLKDNDFDIVSTDIIDYREICRKDIPFIKIKHTDKISKKIPRHDTSLLITVLHHISKKNIIDSLKELSKITKRLIIIKDIWDSSYISQQKKTKNITEFLKLSEKSKENAIKIMDFYGNVITQGLIEMNLPFQFKNMNEWKDILQKSGFSIKNVEFVNLPKVSFHGFFQVKIVCDSNNYKKNIS